ncbi:MAG: AMP-binding protein, partial [Candidatus Hermodarchaeota archaeon]
MVHPKEIPLYPEHVPKIIEYPKKPLFSNLDDSVDEFPENLALVLDTNSFDRIGKMTYRELGEATDKFSAFLVDNGIKPRDKVAVFLPNMMEFVVAYYGILKAGAIVVSLNFQYPVNELTGQLNQSETKGIVCADMITPETQPYETCKIVRDQGNTPLEFIVVASVKPYLEDEKASMGTELGLISKKDPQDIYIHEIYEKYYVEDRPKVDTRPDDVAVIM